MRSNSVELKICWVDAAKRPNMIKDILLIYY